MDVLFGGYGWRGRIGLMITSLNGVVEQEAPKMLPEGVSVHFTRLRYGAITNEGAKLVAESIEEPAKLLTGDGRTPVDVVCFLFWGGSVSKGAGADKEMIERIEKATGVPALTAGTAVVQALEKLGAETVSAGVPIDVQIPGAKQFLEGNGFKVKDVKSLGLPTAWNVLGQPPSVAYRLGRELDSTDVDAVVLPNSNLRTIEAIDPLEVDLGKPVVTGNQASIWACLRKIHVNDPITGFGKLLTKY
jgi:maleate cis-trans isomerase